jgi:hypothetical protein
VDGDLDLLETAQHVVDGARRLAKLTKPPRRELNFALRSDS